jgi:putative nucleotidyltransferase with HDIG domain
MMDARSLYSRIDRISEIPTLPAVLCEINRLMEDPDLTIRRLTAAIETDQSMVLKILKLVNSAFYGCRQRVGSILNAVTLLGFNTVRNAILSLSVVEAFSGSKNGCGIHPKEFWKHSVEVAVTSRFLADKTKLAAPEDGFVAGLLHDIGKFVLSQHFPELFASIRELSRQEDITFFEAEKKSSPTDHAAIGSHLAKRWRLPLNLVEAIHRHHLPREDAQNYRLMALVHLSDHLVNSQRWTRDGHDQEANVHLCAEVKAALEPHLATAREWYPRLNETIEQGLSFLLEKSG